MSLKNEMFHNFSRSIPKGLHFRKENADSFGNMQTICVSVSPKGVSTKVSLIFVPWNVRSFGKKVHLWLRAKKSSLLLYEYSAEATKTAGKEAVNTEGNIWH